MVLTGIVCGSACILGAAAVALGHGVGGEYHLNVRHWENLCPQKLCKLCIKVQCSQQTSGNGKLFLPVSKFLSSLYLQA